MILVFRAKTDIVIVLLLNGFFVLDIAFELIFGSAHLHACRPLFDPMDEDIKVCIGKEVIPYPRVSIVMPAYNVSQYIGEALDSVFDQTVNGFEVIVINDGSTDIHALESALLPYKDRIVYVIQSNSGVSGARNTGLKLARGEYIAMLDPDDAWLPDYLEVQLRELESNPGLDIVYPNAVVFGDTPDAGINLMSLSPSSGPVTVEGLISQSCTVLIFVLARKSVILRAGMFDTSLRSCEDFDLWLRVLRIGGTIGYHKRVLVRYRKRRGSHTSDPFWMYSHLFKVLDKFESNFQLSTNEKECVNRARRRFNAEISLLRGKGALMAGDARLAIDSLTQANSVLKRMKIRLALIMLRIAPAWSSKALRARL